VAHHASAKKRIRQSERRNAANRLITVTVRTNIKKLRRAIESGDQATATELLPEALQGLDRAVTKKCLHARTAARKISRLQRAVNKLAAK
jgi:small subunit ribosomal protein S20